jgi:hypothetical protein
MPIRTGGDPHKTQKLMTQVSRAALLRRIRCWLVVLIAGLVLSGVTAFPLERELRLLNQFFGISSQIARRP